MLTISLSMCTDRNDHLRRADTRGEFFFDRNPRLFKAIMEYYRSGELYPPRDVPRRVFQRELDFFQIDVDANADHATRVVRKLLRFVESEVQQRRKSKKGGDDTTPIDIVISRSSEVRDPKLNACFRVTRFSWSFQRNRPNGTPHSKGVIGCKGIVSFSIWRFYRKRPNQSALLQVGGMKWVERRSTTCVLVVCVSTCEWVYIAHHGTVSLYTISPVGATIDAPEGMLALL
jgi:BTB/POZ domain